MEKEGYDPSSERMYEELSNEIFKIENKETRKRVPKHYCPSTWHENYTAKYISVKTTACLMKISIITQNVKTDKLTDETSALGNGFPTALV